MSAGSRLPHEFDPLSPRSTISDIHDIDRTQDLPDLHVQDFHTPKLSAHNEVMTPEKRFHPKVLGRRPAAPRERMEMGAENGLSKDPVCMFCYQPCPGVVIECSECHDPPYICCPTCFYVGAELNEHKRTHRYRIRDQQCGPLFVEDWNGDEELLLLQLIQKWGLGNWEDVARHMPTKNKYQCQYHYWTTYVDHDDLSTDSLEPPMQRRRLNDDGQRNYIPRPIYAEDPQIANMMDEKGSDIVKISGENWISPKPIQQKKTTITKNDCKTDDRGILLSVLKKKNVEPRIVSQDEMTEPSQRSDNYVGTEIGYLPYRHDFEIEANDLAEQYIAQMELNGDEHDQLKNKLLQIYFRILMDRKKKRDFVFQRNLLDWKKWNEAFDKKDPEHQKFEQDNIPFARFLSLEEYHQYIYFVEREHRLKKRILKLQEYRRNGIKSKEDALNYEKTQLHEKEYKHVHRMMKDKSRDKLFRPKEPELKTPVSQMTNFAEPFEKPQNSKTGAMTRKNDDLYKKLSKNEQKLCKSIELEPQIYLVVKDILIRESLFLGYVTKKSAYKLFPKLQESHISQIYDYLQNAMIIQSGQVAVSSSQTSIELDTPNPPSRSPTEGVVWHF